MHTLNIKLLNINVHFLSAMSIGHLNLQASTQCMRANFWFGACIGKWLTRSLG